MTFLNKIQNRHIEIFLKLCIIFGIILHIVPYFYNRCLWLDEARLASSICTRSLSELVASPLDWGQSAPVGYLFVVKLITMVWGTSEATLRIFSLFSAFVCMYLIYALLKKKVAPKFALWTVAIFSLTNGYVYYGNEVKPYMSDNMFCLLVLYIWQRYRENKIELYQVCLIYAVIVWFSFSAVFFMGACMLIECVHQVRSHKNVKKLLINGALCLLVLVSLILNYVFWLSSTSSNAGEAGYWDLLRFPIVPTSLADIKLIVQMFFEFWAFYPKLMALFFFSGTILYLVVCIKKKEDRSKIFIPYIISVVLLLIASSIGFYPIRNRLLQAYPIVALIVIAITCNDISEYRTCRKINIAFLLQLLLCFSLFYVGFLGYPKLLANGVYFRGMEMTASTDYLKKNLTKDDAVYVPSLAIPVYSYKTDYRISFKDLKKPNSNMKDDALLDLPRQIENVIYGQDHSVPKYRIPYVYESDVKESAIKQDVDIILKYESVYLIRYMLSTNFMKMVEVLRQHGTVEIVVDSYDTQLYHFVRSHS